MRRVSSESMYSLFQLLKSLADLFCETVELINSFQRYVDTLSDIEVKMRVNGIKCDDCGNIQHIRSNLSDRYVSSSEMPDSWFVLVKARSEEREEPLNFCTLGCLKAWVLKKSMSDSEDNKL